MKKHKISTRSAGETRKMQTQRLGRKQYGPRKTLPKDKLIELYVNQEKTITAIAESNGWNRNLVSRELRRNNIPIRNASKTLKFILNQPHIRKRRSERTKGKNNPMFGRFGQKHGAWKPPKKRKTPFYKAVRFCAEYKQWRDEVFQRDEYVCQNCGKRGGDLNADHIVPLAKLLNDNQISTLDEARQCSMLWQKENGRTLCVVCHKKTATYGKKIS